MLLVADVGGTKTALAVLENPSFDDIISEKHVKNKDYNDIYELISDNIDTTDVQSIVIGTAGPVSSGEVRLTNLEWEITEFDLKSKFKVKNVKILNDLEAMAYILPYLNPDDTTELKSGKRTKFNTSVLVAVGTGLGKAITIRGENCFHVIKTEGGHTGFSPHTEEELEYHQYLLEQNEHVSQEMVCSSLGFKNLALYMVDNSPQAFSSELKKAILESKDVAKTIIEFDKEKPTSGARTVIQKIVKYLSYYIGDQSLSVLPDAIYIAGGISQAVKKYLKLVDFKEGMMMKGEIARAIDDISIFLIDLENSGLLGAAAYTFNKELYWIND